MPAFHLPGLTVALGLASAAVASQPAGDEDVRARLAQLPSGPLHVVDPATPSRCRERRRAVARELENGVFFAAAGEEGSGRYRPDDDFYWLTGVDVPGAALVLGVRDGALFAERLYLPPYDRREEVWKGPRLAPGASAAEATGIADIRATTRLHSELGAILDRVELAAGHGSPFEAWMAEKDLKRVRTTRVLRPLQAVKDPSELAVVQSLLEITQAAMVDAMAVAVPGAWEFATEAAVDGGMRRRGAFGPAFPSICASGPNCCVLDYRRNDRQLEAGDLLVLDVGAELHGYSCDLTRTFPVGGRFTERQREIYELVWQAGRQAAAELKPGTRLREVHAVAARFLGEHGFSRERFPHAIGHGLGLRVHDFPWTEDVLEEGMIVTVEPGLYLPEEGIGVRLEDAYLITAEGARLLSAALPSHADELEELLRIVRAPASEGR